MANSPKSHKSPPGQKLGSFGAVCNPLPQPQVESVSEHEGVFHECYDIILKTGNRVTVIGSHFFMLDSNRWVPVQNLRPGCKLQSGTGLVTVTAIVRRQTPFIGKVFNLKVEGADLYLVGPDGIAVRDY